MRYAPAGSGFDEPRRRTGPGENAVEPARGRLLVGKLRDHPGEPGVPLLQQPFRDLELRIEGAERRYHRVLAPHGSSIATPMERAVPAIVRMAISTSGVLRSGSFRSAISRSCAWLSFPATS